MSFFFATFAAGFKLSELWPYDNSYIWKCDEE